MLRYRVVEGLCASIGPTGGLLEWREGFVELTFTQAAFDKAQAGKLVLHYLNQEKSDIVTKFRKTPLMEYV